MAEQDAQVFEAFEAVEDGLGFAVGSFEVGGDLGSSPFAALGAEDIALSRFFLNGSHDRGSVGNDFTLR
jgi:hypothetical protein